MHVTSRPMDIPVALIEQGTAAGSHECVRILVFREGLLARPILELLAKLLHHL